MDGGIHPHHIEQVGGSHRPAKFFHQRVDTFEIDTVAHQPGELEPPIQPQAPDLADEFAAQRTVTDDHEARLGSHGREPLCGLNEKPVALRGLKTTHDTDRLRGALDAPDSGRIEVVHVDPVLDDLITADNFLMAPKDDDGRIPPLVNLDDYTNLQSFNRVGAPGVCFDGTEVEAQIAEGTEDIREDIMLESEGTVDVRENLATKR